MRSPKKIMLNILDEKDDKVTEFVWEKDISHVRYVHKEEVYHVFMHNGTIYTSVNTLSLSKFVDVAGNASLVVSLISYVARFLVFFAVSVPVAYFCIWYFKLFF